MMIKFLTGGALCTALVFGSALAAPSPAHHKLPQNCHCPKGFEFHKGNCVTKDIAHKVATCPYNIPSNQLQSGSTCLKPVAPKLDCPEGFNYVPKVGCVDAEEAEPFLVCPQGFFMDATTNTCTREFNIPPLPTCPEHQFLQNGFCVNVIEESPAAICTGTEAKGKCFLLQSGNNNLECPVGFKLVGSRCEKVEFAQKIYVCHWHSSHFDKNDDIHPTKKCPKIVTVPCHHDHHKRLLAPEDVVASPDVEEAGLSHVLPYHGAFQGHSKSCTKTEYYPAVGRCPRNYVEIDEAAQKYMTHHHYDKKHSPECYHVELLAPEIVCLEKKVSGECRKVVQIPFDLQCPIATPPFSRIGKKCITIDTTGIPTLECPPNTEEVKDPSGVLIACRKVRSVTPKKKCPAGFERKHSKCVQLTIVKPGLCPKFAIQKDSNCYVKVPSIYQCPHGYQPSTENPNECFAIKTQQLICHHKTQYPFAYHYGH